MLVPIPRLTEVVLYLRGSSRVSNTPRQRNIDISHINVVTWWVGNKQTYFHQVLCPNPAATHNVMKRGLLVRNHRLPVKHYLQDRHHY